MTPQVKAKELLNRFMQPVDSLHKYPMCIDTAKQCAIIAVEEILLETIVTIDRPGYYNQYFSPFWMEVKEEIEKL